MELSSEIAIFKRELLTRVGMVIAAINYTKFDTQANCVSCPIEKIYTIIGAVWQRA
jgi:DeoR/GlpR family transcriptional regulator of sugar metabolism